MFTLLATILQAPQIDDIERSLQTVNDQVLVVFDVDYTLIIPEDKLLGACGEKRWHEVIKQLRASEDKGAYLGSVVLLKHAFSLVDPKLPGMIKKLQDNHIKTIALTAMDTGAFGLVPSMEEWRINQLSSLGISFKEAFLPVDTLTLAGFQGKKNLPVYKQGVLATAKYPKGDVLVAFLKAMHWKPSKVIFIDDRMEYIRSVEEALAREGIESLSLHYTEAIDREESLDEAIAEVQIAHLLQHKEWLSDKEALAKRE